MKVIGQRVIAYLKSDTTLVNLLGSARNIYARGLNEPDNRPAKSVIIECSPGEDLNYAAGQMDDFDIEVCVNRREANSYSVLMDIVGRVDDLINKSEVNLSTASWKILNLTRSDSPTRGALIDEKTNEYYFLIRYSYILDESS